jgi:hypothetical protein
MKEIRTFLNNQKDIAIMRYVELMKVEEVNMVDVKYWLERYIHLDRMVKDFNEVHGDGKTKKK